MALIVKSIKAEKYKSLFKAVEAVGDLGISVDIRHHHTLYRYWTITLMGHRFKNKDVFEAMREALKFVCRAKGIQINDDLQTDKQIDDGKTD